MRTSNELLKEYEDFCEERGFSPQYITDVDGTALIGDSPVELGKLAFWYALGKSGLLSDEIFTEIKGAFHAFVHGKILGNEEKGLEGFFNSLRRANLTEDEIKQFSDKVVLRDMNPAFDYFLREIKEQEPSVLVKTIGLHEVADAVKDYIKEIGISDVETIGNKYESERIEITGKNQIEKISEILDDRGIGLEGAVFIDDRDIFGEHEPYAFIASNLAPNKVKKIADYVLE